MRSAEIVGIGIPGMPVLLGIKNPWNFGNIRDREKKTNAGNTDTLSSID